MKIRSGFVTNSSSSSYIIKFDGDIEDLEFHIRTLINIYNDIKGNSIEVPSISYYGDSFEIEPDYDIYKILEPFFEIEDNRNG